MINRRTFSKAVGLGTGAVAVSPAGLRGTASAAPAARTASGSAAPTVPAITPGTHTGFTTLKHVRAGVLNIGYAEAGPAHGPVVLLLHGWPYDIHSYVDVAPLLADQGYRCLRAAAAVEHNWWYQWYFASERGKRAMENEEDRIALCRYVWTLVSPTWNFSDAVFNRTAEAFNNPDYAAVVLYNYRWRIGLVEGEPRYDRYEKRLWAQPSIHVPTVTLDAALDPFTPPPGRRLRIPHRLHRSLPAPHARQRRAQPSAGSAHHLRPGRGRRRPSLTRPTGPDRGPGTRSTATAPRGCTSR